MTLLRTTSLCAGFALLFAHGACSPKGGESTGESTESASTADTDNDTTAGPDATDPSTGTDPGTGTSTGSTGSSSGSTDTGNEFIVPGDGGVAGQCDPLSQDCPEGEKCTAVSMTEGEPWEINVCKPIMGTGQVGDVCNVEGGKYTGLDNCDKGYICLLTDEEGIGGTCVEFCNDQMMCPETGVQCEVYNMGSLPICLPTCHPLLQDCPEGLGCYNGASGTNFVCFKVTAEPGEGMQGDQCNYINQCLPGLFCANAAVVTGCPAMSSGCCTPYCDLNDPDPAVNCQMGEDCLAYFDPPENAPPEYADVGVCAIPQ